jgi:UDPglucose 6-dehydrogenase
MRLGVVGTGYVGLVAGAGFADFGNEVICADTDADKIERLSRGQIPIYEPGLEALVKKNVEKARLRFTAAVSEAIAGMEAVFIAVGTPQAPDGRADLSAVLAVAETIGKAATGFTVVVTKSTVPVGSADRIRETIGRHARHEFAVASNPEFLKEGDAVNDFMKPDRVIVGADDDRARELLRRLYAPIVRTNDRLHMMDARSAELTKYAANAMLATRISFMNELANLAEKVGADIEKVRRGIGSDPRIGPKFLFAGTGFGGSCFPKDVKALQQTAREAGAPLAVVEAVDRANDAQKTVLAQKLLRHFGKLDGLRIAVWGISFKPETDDIREAPALALIDRLLEAGARVSAHDPAAMEGARRRYGDRVTLVSGMYDALYEADALVLVTEWHDFRRPDFARVKTLLARPVVFDGRNIWDPEELRALGFTYYGIGRP